LSTLVNVSICVNLNQLIYPRLMPTFIPGRIYWYCPSKDNRANPSEQGLRRRRYRYIWVMGNVFTKTRWPYSNSIYIYIDVGFNNSFSFDIAAATLTSTCYICCGSVLQWWWKLAPRMALHLKPYIVVLNSIMVYVK